MPARVVKMRNNNTSKKKMTMLEVQYFKKIQSRRHTLMLYVQYSNFI